MAAHTHRHITRQLKSYTQADALLRHAYLHLDRYDWRESPELSEAMDILRHCRFRLMRSEKMFRYWNTRLFSGSVVTR